MDSASKRTLSWLLSFLQAQGRDTQHLWNLIADIVVKTLVGTLEVENSNAFILSAVKPTVSHMQINYKHGTFELLGFDILLDQNLRPW